MATIARFLARRIPDSQAESDVLKQLALFAFAGANRSQTGPTLPALGPFLLGYMIAPEGSFIAGQRSTRLAHF